MMFDRGFMALPTCVALVAVLVCLAQRVGMWRTCPCLVLMTTSAPAAVTLFRFRWVQLGSPQDQLSWGRDDQSQPFAGIARTGGGRCSNRLVDDCSNHRGRGNVLMFVPLGFALLSERFHRFRTTLFVRWLR